MEPMLLIADISGGQAPYTVSWSDGSTGDSIWFIPQAGGNWVFATATDAGAVSKSDSIWMQAHDACVWPGDANGDGQANNLDILPIGLGFGNIGPARPEANLLWMAQPADNWNSHTPNGTDYVHSDTDGNGVIHVGDVQGITTNYLAPQSQPGVSVSSGGDGVPLFVEFPASNFSPGDTVVASVILGTAQFPADSVYGIAFSVIYDAALFDSGSVQVEYSNNWLGSKGVDLITVDRDFYHSSQVDIGMSRTNQVFRSGYGQIATIIVTIDDIAGKTGGVTMIDFDISNVSLTSSSGQAIKVSPTQTQLGISLSATADLEKLEWNAYPIPARNALTIDLPPSLSRSESTLTITDMLGKNMYTTKTRSSSTNIYTDGIPSGAYLLRVYNDSFSDSKVVTFE